MKNKKVLALVESAVMIALATVLSLFPLADLPYGGSITIAAMLPIIIISYRHGLSWGFGSGFVFGIIQQLLGLKNLSYFTTWQSIVVLVLFDYIIAYAVCGIGGIFRHSIKSQACGLMLGSALTCILRYLCHVLSGATIWAGLSIPTQAALGYSLIYNATYMLPEMIIMIAVSLWLGSSLDFRTETPIRMQRSKTEKTSPLLPLLSGLCLTGAAVYDIVAVFTHLQDAETGEFTVTQLGAVNWTTVIIVTLVGIIAAAALMAVRAAKRNSAA